MSVVIPSKLDFGPIVLIFKNLFLLMLSFGVKHLPSFDPKISGLQFLLRFRMLALIIIKQYFQYVRKSFILVIPS